MRRNSESSPKEISAWFISHTDRDAGDLITHLKLQKLLYYAQAWALVLLDKQLFSEDFQAWAHGPVIESVFYLYRDCGWDPLPYPTIEVVVDSDVNDHLSEILDVYGDFSAKHLEKMTHMEAPWREARGGLPPEARSNAVISKESMRSYYKELYNRSINNGEKQGA